MAAERLAEVAVHGHKLDVTEIDGYVRIACACGWHVIHDATEELLPWVSGA